MTMIYGFLVFSVGTFCGLIAGLFFGASKRDEPEPCSDYEVK
jgi:hypothetical protein